MASKGRKASTPAMSTPASSSTASRSSAASPLSPTRYNRMQEKVDLQNLNDRLATYIDRVRQLESENTRLTREIQSFQETSTREVTGVKRTYENEISEARKLLDDTSREKAKLEIDFKRVFEELAELKLKHDKKCKDFIVAEKNSAAFEKSYNELTGKFNQVQAERKKAVDDLKELEKEAEKLRKLTEAQRKQLDDEMLGRVEAENQLQSAREELSLRDQVHQQEIKEVRTRRQMEITEHSSRIEQQYNDEMQKALDQLRSEYEAQMRTNREDVDRLYETKIADLKNQMQRSSGASTQALEESRRFKLELDAVGGKISSLEANNAAHMARISELEHMLNAERERSASDKMALESEIRRLRDEASVMLNEYQDLMDIKVALDTEIKAYQALLSSEETRLNITPRASPTVGHSSRFTPSRGTPLRGTKRKRTMMESEDLDEYDTKASSSGDIEFIDSCPQGKYVKLRNKGTKEVSLAGCTLNRSAGDQETTFKFHRSTKLEPGATTTVWSSDQNQTHELPTNIVMKSQKWFSAPEMLTLLFSNDGTEMAKLEQVRVQRSLAATRHGEVFAENGHGQQERCTIM